MMTFLRSVSIAFTTYTIIPMPVFEWKEDDTKYSMCAFPSPPSLALVTYSFISLRKSYTANTRNKGKAKVARKSLKNVTKGKTTECIC